MRSLRLAVLVVGSCLVSLAGCNEDALEISVVGDGAVVTDRGGPSSDAPPPSDLAPPPPPDLSVPPPPDLAVPQPDLPVAPPDLVPLPDLRLLDLGPPAPDLSGPPPPLVLSPPVYQGGAGMTTSVTAADFNGDGLVDVGTVGLDLAVSLARKGGRWMVPLDASLGRTDNHVAVFADFDGDKKLDAATTNMQGNSITLLSGNGDGSFKSGATLAVGREPGSIVAVDLNADGKLDLVTANMTDRSISVLNGVGDGTFSAPRTFQTTGSPAWMVSGDSNGDGNLDIITAPGGGDVAVHLGDGKGGLGAATTYPVRGNPMGMATSDFNKDGHADLVVTVFDGSTVVLISSGNGYHPGLVLPVGSFNSAPAVGDWNGDKNADIAVQATLNGAAVVVPLFGDGGKKFVVGPPVRLDKHNTGGASQAIDLDRDGTLDLVTVAYDGTGEWLAGDGKGGFTVHPLPIYSGSGPLVTADLDNDGLVDGLGTTVYADDAWLSSILSSGDGRFVGGGRVAQPIGFPATGDFNGDGRMDAILVPYAKVSSVFLAGNGDGSFQKGNGFAALVEPSAVPTVVDFEADGKLDLFVPANGAELFRYPGNGNGTLGAGVRYAVPSSPRQSIVGDWDGDGRVDVAVANGYAGTVGVFLHAGNDLSPMTAWKVGSNTTGIAAADFDNDGRLDLAAADGNGLLVLMNTGGGNFAMPVNHGKPSLYAIAAGDLNRDRRPDIVATTSSAIVVFVGNGDGTFQPAVNFPLAHTGSALSIIDLDNDKRPDVVSSGTAGPWLAVFLNRS